MLIVGGGRCTQLSCAAVIAFYLGLWLFGWIETAWSIAMIPTMVLRAERRSAPPGDRRLIHDH
ncbi:hypothetical protein KRM28CT15_44680 [Krasilnikovia sp. M28-CT-15]